jgi:hypothetical protein
MNKPGPTEVGAAITRHRTEPDVSRDAHARRKIIELGESLVDRRAVYLDTRFWIHLRDAALGRADRAEYVELLEVLRTGVSDGRVFCPVNWASLVELLKQSDPASRQATAALVDELGQGVALCDEPQRIATELSYSLHRHGQHGNLHPLAHLVWVRVPYVFGISHPVPTQLDPDLGLALSKAFFDHLWEKSAAEVIARIPGRLPADDMTGAAARLSRGIADHVYQVRSFQDTYQNEIAGVLDLHADTCADVLQWLFERTAAQDADPTPEMREDTKKKCYSMLVAAAEAGKGARIFPTLHAYSKCHAAIRWDKKRGLDSNTLFDLHHGVAAVVYCDAFLTDGGMRALMTQNHVALDREFGCTVMSSVAEAVEFLRADNWAHPRPSRYYRDA